MRLFLLTLARCTRRQLPPSAPPASYASVNSKVRAPLSVYTVYVSVPLCYSHKTLGRMSHQVKCA